MVIVISFDQILQLLQNILETVLLHSKLRIISNKLYKQITYSIMNSPLWIFTF